MDEINTDGGSAISGNADTGGGDFTGRDREPANSNLAIGGDLKNSTIATGKGNRVDNRRQRRNENRSGVNFTYEGGEGGNALFLAFNDLSMEMKLLAQAFNENRGESRQQLSTLINTVAKQERQIQRLMEMETDITRHTTEQLQETRERLWLQTSVELQNQLRYVQIRFYTQWIIMALLIAAVVYLWNR